MNIELPRFLAKAADDVVKVHTIVIACFCIVTLLSVLIALLWRTWLGVIIAIVTCSFSFFHGVRVPEPIFLNQGETRDLGLVLLEPTVEVEVKVVNSKGTPLEGILINLTYKGGGQTGPDGIAQVNLYAHSNGKLVARRVVQRLSNLLAEVPLTCCLSLVHRLNRPKRPKRRSQSGHSTSSV